MLVLKNGEPVAAIPLLDRAFHYGDGCFTTARIKQNCIELETLHLARLQLACQRLMLNLDLALIQISLEKIKLSMGELNGTLKMVISRGEGQRGYLMPEHPADLYVFYTEHPVGNFQPECIHSGLLTQLMGLSMPNLVGIKTLNRLEQVLLKQEAHQLGWSEALVADIQGSIVEGVSSNCFIRMNGTWITPELRYNGVHGVMRTEILKRMQQYDIPCNERQITTDELPNIESLFFCNALNPMKIVQTLGQRPLQVQPCMDLFQALQLDQI